MQRASSDQPSGVRRKGGRSGAPSNDASASTSTEDGGVLNSDSRQLTQSGSRKRVRFASKEDEGHRLFGLSSPSPSPSSHSHSPALSQSRAQDASAATDLAHSPSNPLRSSLVSLSASPLMPEGRRRKHTSWLPDAGIEASPSHLSLHPRTGDVLSPDHPDFNPHSNPHSHPRSNPRSGLSEASCDPLSERLPHLSSPCARPSPSSLSFDSPSLRDAHSEPLNPSDRGGASRERGGGSGEAGSRLGSSFRGERGGEGGSAEQMNLRETPDEEGGMGLGLGADSGPSAGVPRDMDSTVSMSTSMSTGTGMSAGGLSSSLGRPGRMQRLNLQPIVVQRINHSLERRTGLLGGSLGGGGGGSGGGGVHLGQASSREGNSLNSSDFEGCPAPSGTGSGGGASTSRSQSFDDTLMREVDDLVALMPQMRLERSRSELEILMKRRQLLGTYLGTPKSGTGTPPQLPRTHSF